MKSLIRPVGVSCGASILEEQRKRLAPLIKERSKSSATQTHSLSTVLGFNADLNVSTPAFA